MKGLLIKAALPFILDFVKDVLTADKLRGYASRLFALIEDAVKDSATPWDDRIVLPVVASFRNLTGTGDAGTVAVPGVVAILEELLTVERARYLVDRLFDLVEEYTEDSATKWDDLIALPILRQLRQSLGVPDEGEYADAVEVTA